MGKMKELFMQHSFASNMMSDAEYQDWLHSQGYKSPTIEDHQAEHDAWWDSLTNEQKQELFEEQEAMEKERIELSIEEMNHDLSFGK